MELATPAESKEMEDVMRRLKCREENRARQASERAELAKENQDPRESAETFLQDFRRGVEELSQLLVTNSSTSTTDQVGSARERLQLLDQRLSAASYWLPQYDLRRLQSELADVSVQLGKVAAPRRRFAFSGPSKVADTARKDVTSRSVSPPVNGSLPEASRASEQPHAGPSTLTVSSAAPGEVLCVEAGGKDVNISGLNRATVRLEGCPSALYVSSLSSCTIHAGPVSGACLIEGATKCRFELAAHQIRIHNSTESSFALRVSSGPIIEHSSGLVFGPLDVAEGSRMAKELESQNFPANDVWSHVQDFGWLKSTPSPNWQRSSETV